MKKIHVQGWRAVSGAVKSILVALRYGLLGLSLAGILRKAEDRTRKESEHEKKQWVQMVFKEKFFALFFFDFLLIGSVDFSFAWGIKGCHRQATKERV